MGKAAKSDGKQRKKNRQRLKQNLEPLPTAKTPAKKDEEIEEEEDEDDDDDSDALEYDSETGEIGGKTAKDQGDDSSDDDSDDDDDNDDETMGGGTLKMSKHKRDMEKLKASDPEFFKYLESADKDLLDFEASDEEELEGEEDEEEEEMEEDDEEKDDDDDGIHKPPDKLEVASDESDAEDVPTKEEREKSKKSRGGVKVTQKMISAWSAKLRDEASLGALRKLIGAFRCAVQQCGTRKEEEKVKQVG